MELEFIGNLFESKLFPDRNSLKSYNERETKNMIFIYMLALQILIHEDYTNSFAHDYLYKTFKYGKFNSLELSSNDLYWILFHLKNNIDKKFNLYNLQDFVKNVLKEKTTTSEDSRRFLQLQSQLNINESSYKSLRILISHWNELSLNQKKLAMTRLILIFRTHFFKSDLLYKLEQLISKKKLEIKDVKNPELDSRIFEEVSTTSSSIATVVQPLQQRVIKRSNRSKRKV
jgi:hypothetical protein